MDEFLQELSDKLPTTYELLTITFRLCLAALLAAVPGFQRERLGRAAGLRTHMMVSLGAAIFVIAALEAGASDDATMRVVQGLATGIGFVGAGAILKSKDEREIHGLTTAASIWLTAGLGTAAGLGLIWLPILGAILALIILSLLQWISLKVGPPHGQAPTD